MTSRDPTWLLLAWDDETPTDVRRDCFALKVNIWLPLLKFSLLEAGLRDNTNTGCPGGFDCQLGIGATYFLSSAVAKQTEPAGQGWRNKFML